MINLIKSGLLLGLLMIPGLFLQISAQSTPEIPNMDDLEQMMQMQEVSGKYTNTDYKVSVDLPEGWSGSAIDFTDPSTGDSITSLSVMEGGLEANSESMDAGIFSMIMLSIVDKPEDASIPEPTSPDGEEVECTEITTGSVDINGKKVLKMQSECTSDGTTMKTRSYYYATAEKVLTYSYSTSPASDFDSDLDAFETSVKTLTIENLVDVDYEIPSEILTGSESSDMVNATDDTIVNATDDTIVNATDDTIVNATDDTIVNATDDTIEEDDASETTAMSPLKQMNSGVKATDVVCAQDKELMIKTGTEQAACVKSSSTSKLVEIGWGILA
jgi:hypothetical protein